MIGQIEKPKGTIVWVAPFYNRSGYGVLARASVSALYSIGIPVKIIPVNEVELGVDDVDMELIKSLETTPLVPPVTVIISHVPSKYWFNLNIPEPRLMIMSTTFDSSAQGNLPPAEWWEVFHKMDQIWLQSYKERDLYIANGIPPEKMHIVHYPDSWKENPILPPINIETYDKDNPFRFLSIAMYQPRRRWDILIEAFLEEYKTKKNVELYLKVNYPPWHPIPGKPRTDLHELINTLRLKTGSNAPIIVDEELGTRRDIVELIDSCNACVSTDTVSTGPITEARVRHRLVVISSTLKIMSVENYIEIEEDSNLRKPLTPDMILYQPHHKDAFMPQLRIPDVRNALRKAFDLTIKERTVMCEGAAEGIPGPKEALPLILNSIKAGWEYKKNQLDIAEPYRRNILWEGKTNSKSSLAKVNFEMLKELNPLVENLKILSDDNVKEFSNQLVDKTKYETKNVSVGIHVRHEFPPNLEPPQSGRWVIIQPWEFGSLPRKWVNSFAKDVDEMWVPSNYVKQCYLDSGIPESRVFIIPNGFNPKFYNKEKSEIKLQTKKKFKFLFVGGTIYRKGIDILLKAYTEQFSSNDDVSLVIKDMGGNSFYDGQTYANEIRKIQQNINAPEIEYIDKFISEEELKGLYQYADVLVHPYRGEGFGLPILESMACGTPAMVTNGGAALDFCNSENSFLVKAEKIFYKEKKVGELETVAHPWLFEVSVDELKKRMQYCVENREETLQKGNSAYKFVRSNFTWQKNALKIKEQIAILSMKPIIRFENKKKEKIFLFAKYIDETFKFIEENKHKNALYCLDLALNNYISTDSENAIELDELLIVKGNLHFATNNLEKAKESFEKALNENPNSSAACQGLGEIFQQIEEYEPAKMMFEWAVKNDESNNVAKQKLAVLNKSLGLDENDFSL